MRDQNDHAFFINLLLNHAKEQPRNIVINLYAAKEITVTIRIEPTAGLTVKLDTFNKLGIKLNYTVGTDRKSVV